eukprot:446245-Pelagomonas_calceolata.AAC.1
MHTDPKHWQAQVTPAQTAHYRSKAAAASAAAAKSSWAAAKAPFVRMASMLAMRAGAADAARAGSTKATGGGYVQGWGSSSRGKGDV